MKRNKWMHSILSVKSFNEVSEHSTMVDGVCFWSFLLSIFARFYCAETISKPKSELLTISTLVEAKENTIQSTGKHTNHETHNNEIERLTTEIKAKEKRTVNDNKNDRKMGKKQTKWARRKKYERKNTILSLCDVTCEDDFEIQQNDRKKSRKKKYPNEMNERWCGHERTQQREVQCEKKHANKVQISHSCFRTQSHKIQFLCMAAWMKSYMNERKWGGK